MRNIAVFGVPIALWLFPPIAIAVLARNVIKSTKDTSRKVNKDG
jgi:hypothetical protein